MILNIAKKSRSYRRFDSKFEICKDILKDLVSITRFCPSSRNIQPYKFFLSYTKENNEKIFPNLRWAGLLKDWDGPSEGERPTAYIIILADKSVVANPPTVDIGIIAQTILLYAAELELNGCMIGSMENEKIRKELNIDKKYDISLVIALGRGAEKIIIEDTKNGETNYYRDENGNHHVPKRKLDEIIINE